MSEDKVSVIIVSWNGEKFLKTCLESIYNQTYQNYEVILVDNNSHDGSLRIAQQYSLLKIVKPNNNTGFARGNNIGIKEAFKSKEVKYICTLNNDTKVASNFLEELVKIIKKGEDIGSVQPLLIFSGGLIQSAGLMLPQNLLGVDAQGLSRGFKKSEDSYDKIEEIFAPTAAAALYKREMLEKIGLFDEDFFCYGEDLDLGLRARLVGWRAYFTPRTKVIHFHSQTKGAASGFKAYYIRRNTNLTAFKNLPLLFYLKYIVYAGINYLKLMGNVKNTNTSTGKLTRKLKLFGMLKLVIKINFGTMKYLPRMWSKRKNILKTRKISNRQLSELFNQFG